MLPDKDRIISLLEDAVSELDLLLRMSENIKKPDDFVTSLSGITVFRACGMSLQYITEIFVKIRNLCGQEYFAPYSTIRWPAVFGMRNFLSHEYVSIDAEGFFDTIKNNIPPLLSVAEEMLSNARQ